MIEVPSEGSKCSRHIHVRTSATFSDLPDPRPINDKQVGRGEESSSGQVGVSARGSDFRGPENRRKSGKNPEKIPIFGPPVPRPSCRQRARLAEIHISQKGSAPRFSGIFGIFSRLIQAIFPPIPALISTGLRKIDKIGGRASPRSGSDDFRTISDHRIIRLLHRLRSPLTVNHRPCDANRRYPRVIALGSTALG